MKFVVALIAAVVVLATVCHKTDAAITVHVPQRLSFGYPRVGDCTCENCACKSRQACAMENIVPNQYCPGSFIFVCCKTVA